jgi:transcriptional regulator with XRE-family HTH domain
LSRILDNQRMSTPTMASYLRSLRLQSGLSQRELADLVGVVSHQQVSQHERSTVVPSLVAAFAYQIVFGVPITQVFPGIAETVSQNVEERMRKMKDRLEESAVRGRGAQKIARTLEWYWQRENPGATDAAT